MICFPVSRLPQGMPDPFTAEGFLAIHNLINELVRENPLILGGNFILWGSYKRTLILPSSKGSNRSCIVEITIVRVMDKTAKANHAQQTFGVFWNAIIPYSRIVLTTVLILLLLFEKYGDIDKVLDAPLPDCCLVLDECVIRRIVILYTDIWQHRLRSIGLTLSAFPEKLCTACIKSFRRQFMQNTRRPQFCFY